MASLHRTMRREIRHRRHMLRSTGRGLSGNQLAKFIRRLMNPRGELKHRNRAMRQEAHMHGKGNR